MPPMPQDPFVDGDMTNSKLVVSIMNLNQLMIAQDHVINNNFVFQAN